MMRYTMPTPARISPFIFLTLMLLLETTPASATVYLPADFTEMVNASTFIVHGSVVDVRSETTSDRRAIVTYVTVDVAQPLKGTPGVSVTFLVPGGQIGRYERIVVGAPQFDRGDEVVLFLTSRGPSIPYVFGLSQGVYRVSRASGRALVVPPAVLVRQGEGNAAGRVVRGDPARRALPLDEFAREVRATAKSAAAERVR
jgi:hypothetical protein